MYNQKYSSRCHQMNHSPSRHQMHKRKWNMSGFEAMNFYPPVNIQELDDKYELELIVPGRKKDDFKLSLTDNILTISAEQLKSDDDAQDWSRRDYKGKGFTRHFEINEKINPEKISAGYSEGVLKVTLLKKEGSETVKQEILVQ